MSTSTSVSACFEHTAGLHAERVAMTCEGEEVRYVDLDAASQAVARSLRAGPPRAPVRVALLFTDRIASVKAILGVLRAGDAYVPLDADDPDERVQRVLRDCEPSVLIAQDMHVERAHSLLPRGCRLLALEDALRGDAAVVLPHVTPDALAYIFYTSGSTGQPKGVCHTHANLHYFIESYARALEIREDDRLALLSSLSFSASNMDIYGALLTGASVHAYDVRRHGVAPMPQWLEAKGITILHTVPTVFRHLTASVDPTHRFTTIRYVDLGGEAAFGSDVQSFRKHFRGDARLSNRLAATESMLIAQHVVAPGDAWDSAQVLPVGRSPDGVEVRIARDDGTDASAGETGHLVIRTPYLTTGYWNRAELNASVFSEDPERSGWRVYRTKDLGRLAPDGQLYFLGREGTRIKIRGQSIELTEVEAGLRQCESVRDAAVTAEGEEGRPEVDRLVAYVVSKNSSDRDPRKVRRELSRRLPGYMLPSLYVFLDALPLTATGKVDAAALSQVQGSRRGRSEDYEPPQGELERRIAGVLETVLNHAPVGRHDDFFLLGGDSLSVMELKTLLTDLLGYEVTDLLEDATVAGIAQRHRQLQPDAVADKRLPLLVPLRTEGSGPILFLVHGRHGQAHVSRAFLDLVGRAQRVYSFQARGVDGLQEPNETLVAMAQDYVAAMREVQPRGPYFLGGLCAGGYVAVEMARVLVAQGEPSYPILMIDPPLPFFRATDKQKQLATLKRRLHQRAELDGTTAQFADETRWLGATRVAEAFEDALFRHKLVPYAGPICLLTNRVRSTMPRGWQDPRTHRLISAGTIYRFDVGNVHRDVLDVHNDRFRSALAHCVQTVQAGAMAPSLASAVPFDVAGPFDAVGAVRTAVRLGARWARAKLGR